MFLARYIGITTIDMEEWPVYRLDQYRTVMQAEQARNEKANPPKDPNDD